MKRKFSIFPRKFEKNFATVGAVPENCYSFTASGTQKANSILDQDWTRDFLLARIKTRLFQKLLVKKKNHTLSDRCSAKIAKQIRC